MKENNHIVIVHYFVYIDNEYEENSRRRALLTYHSTEFNNK